MFEIENASSSSGASIFSGVSLEGFRPVAYMRSAYSMELPAGCNAGDCDKAGLLFANNTGQTQEIMVASESLGVPRFKSRFTDLIPRNTDIWVKGGQRFNYSLVAGVLYRFELNLYAQGEKKNVQIPAERLAEITVRNISNNHKTLYINGDATSSLGIDEGKSVRISVPGGEAILSLYSEDIRDAYYVIVRPQPGMTIDMM
jgi:hypothetical protein